MNIRTRARVEVRFDDDDDDGGWMRCEIFSQSLAVSEVWKAHREGKGWVGKGTILARNPTMESDDDEDGDEGTHRRARGTS